MRRQSQQGIIHFQTNAHRRFITLDLARAFSCQHLLYCWPPVLDMQDYTFRLYSDDVPRQFQRGDKVFVWLKSDRSTGLATILQTPDGLSLDSPFDGRYLVRYDVDNTLTAHVRPERLYPVYSEENLILVCYSTADYRRLARSQVNRSDSVLELGCSYGMCTHMLAEHAGLVIGIDNSEEVVREAQSRYPHLRFEVADVLDQPAAILEISNSAGSSASSSSKGCNAVFADIGGNRQLEALLRLIPWVLQQLKPRLLVVKSEELAAAAGKQLLFQQQQQQPHVLEVRQQLHKDLQLHQPADGIDQIHSGPVSSDSKHPVATSGSSSSSRGRDSAASQIKPPTYGEILEPETWWTRLEVWQGLNPLLHAGQAEIWFLNAKAEGFVKKPLRYPQRFTSSGIRICRPFNYDRCYKTDTCEFDHEHCHHCGGRGHRAVDCPVG